MTKAAFFAIALLAAGCATSTAPVAAPSMEAPAVADTPIKSPSGEYNLDPRHTTVTWKVQHMGLSLYTARFDKTSGTLTLDGTSPTKSKVSISIDAHSVSTNLPMPGKEKFDAEIAKGIGADKTPNITFVSTELVRTGPQSGRMIGDLTMNGITKPATFNIVLRGENTNLFGIGIGIEATGTIKRSDWGVDYAKAFAGDDVVIEVESDMNKKK